MGGSAELGPLPPVTNVTMYHGTIGVVPPNDSVIGDQVRNGIDTAYLLQDAKACPSLVYLNSTDMTSLPVLDAVITAMDVVRGAWDRDAGTPGTVHVAVASPGYSAIGSWRCGYI